MSEPNNIKKFICEKFLDAVGQPGDCDFEFTGELEKVIEEAERHEVAFHDFGDLPNLTQIIISTLEDA